MRRLLAHNRFSGSVPSTISTLTGLKTLCGRRFSRLRLIPNGTGLHLDPRECVIRDLDGNDFIGSFPAGILAQRSLTSLYAPAVYALPWLLACYCTRLQVPLPEPLQGNRAVDHLGADKSLRAVRPPAFAHSPLPERRWAVWSLTGCYRG